MYSTRNRIPTATAVQLGRWAEANLTSFIQQARHELNHGEGDPGMILSMGIALCRARQDVREGLRQAELCQWEGRQL
jgi:hypothetical protein